VRDLVARPVVLAALDGVCWTLPFGFIWCSSRIGNSEYMRGQK
jgi:hypothetical protein